MHGRVYLKQQANKKESTGQESWKNTVASIELEMTPVGPTWPSQPMHVREHIIGSDNLGWGSSSSSVRTSTVARGSSTGSIPEVQTSRGFVDLDNVLVAPVRVAEGALANPGHLIGEFWAPMGIGLMPLKVCRPFPGAGWSNRPMAFSVGFPSAFLPATAKCWLPIRSIARDCLHARRRLTASMRTRLLTLCR